MPPNTTPSPATPSKPLVATAPPGAKNPPLGNRVDPVIDSGKAEGFRHPDARPSIQPAAGTGAETEVDQLARREEVKKQDEIASNTEALRRELSPEVVPIRDLSRHNSLLQEQAQVQAMLDSKPGNKRVTVIGPDNVVMNATLQREDAQTRPETSLRDEKTPKMASRPNV